MERRTRLLRLTKVCDHGTELALAGYWVQMSRLVPLVLLLTLWVAAQAQAEEKHRGASRAQQVACPVTQSAPSSHRYGSRRLWTRLPAAGVLRVRRNHPDDGAFGTKLSWIPDRACSLALEVSGQRLDAPGRMRVRGVFWGYSSAGKGSWASAVAFPKPGCWQITGRAGPTTLSYVVKVVAE